MKRVEFLYPSDKRNEVYRAVNGMAVDIIPHRYMDGLACNYDAVDELSDRLQEIDPELAESIRQQSMEQLDDASKHSKPH